MSVSINILQRAENVEIAPLFNTYSKVIASHTAPRAPWSTPRRRWATRSA